MTTRARAFYLLKNWIKATRNDLGIRLLLDFLKSDPTALILMFNGHALPSLLMQWFGLNHCWQWTRRTWSYRFAIIYFFWTLLSNRHSPLLRCARFCLYPKSILKKSSPEWLASSSKISTSLALSSTGPSTWDSFSSSYKCQFAKYYIKTLPQIRLISHN